VSKTPDLRAAAARLTPFTYVGAQSAPGWSFTGGFPDPAHFPFEELLACLSDAALEDPGVLQYGGPVDETLRYGESTLRAELLHRLGDDLGPSADLANVMLTTGSIGAIELAFRAFLDPGDVVALESPTWPAAIVMARQLRAKLVTVPVDRDGLSVDQLAEVVASLDAQGNPVKLVYTIPTFQTPTGSVLHPARRARLAALAAEYNFLVLEDGTYAALRYDGDPVASVQSYDAGGRVLRVGSFSKTVAPALRIGWAAGDARLLETLASARTDLGVSHWAARALALFLRAGHYDRHLDRMLAAYRHKRDLLHAALVRECAGLADWELPAGGYFFWLRLRELVDAGAATQLAADDGIACRPGEQFFGLPAEGAQLLRIAFSQIAEDRIDEGIAVLGRALRASSRKAQA
jgi:2-aminoadipate transaminase